MPEALKRDHLREKIEIATVMNLTIFAQVFFISSFPLFLLLTDFGYMRDMSASLLLSYYLR